MYYRLDAILHDGIYNTKITELTGISGSGKTRFCYKLILSILARTSEKVLYIDSGSSFSIERLEYYCTVSFAAFSFKLITAKKIFLFLIFSLRT